MKYFLFGKVIEYFLFGKVTGYFRGVLGYLTPGKRRVFLPTVLRPVGVKAENG